MVRRLLLLTTVLLAGVFFFLLATLPSRPVHAEWAGDPSVRARTVAGAYHVHTARSDGARDRAAVAAAAARAALRFVIFTDHGDGTRAPEPPAYLSGVLCLDGVEISTNGGHYVALGMPQAPYPLGGEPAAVVEDVARLGGFGFTAHPDSSQPELAWTDWTLPFDGIEWLNADSEWRDERRVRLARALLDYFVRPGPALATLLDRPAVTLARWDALSTRRTVIALAAHDAHGGIGRGVEDGGRQGIPLPSYEASFRSFSSRALLEAPLSGDAAADGRALLMAIRQGRVFTAIDAVAGPALLDLGGSAAGIRADASMPPGAELVLLRDGVEVAKTTSGHAEAEPAPGAFRVEVRVPGAPGNPPVPWLTSNAVYATPPLAKPGELAPEKALAEMPADVGWHVEHDPSSAGTLSVDRGAIRFEYRLGPGERGSQFSGIVGDTPGGLDAADGIAFRAQGDRPMRVSVQFKFDGGDRWGRSVYVGARRRNARVTLDEMLPLDRQTGPPPDPSSIRAVLFVIDRTNARPGDTGMLEISNVNLVR